MSTTVVPPAASFDAKAYIKEANQAEADRRAGKVPPIKSGSEVGTPPPGGPPVAPPIDGEPTHARVSRSQRRESNRLREELGAARARADMMAEELERSRRAAPAASAAAPVADPEPQRAQFQSDAEYNRALGRWDARQEVAKATKQAEAKGVSDAQLQAYLDRIAAADEKAREDQKLFADWDAVREGAAEDPIEFRPDDHPVLMSLIALSDQKAKVLYHFAKDQQALQALLDLAKSPDELIARFHRLEGRLEREYTPKEEKKAPTAAERDAAKPAPSETVRVNGGTAAPDKTPMFIQDARGRNVLNPAWKHERNEAEVHRHR